MKRSRYVLAALAAATILGGAATVQATGPASTRSAAFCVRGGTDGSVGTAPLYCECEWWDPSGKICFRWHIGHRKMLRPGGGDGGG